MSGDADGGSAATILLVDDNEAARYATSRILRGAGYRVREAASGTDTIAQATTGQPDLVVLDINLPDIDGFEVCRALRAHPRTERTPIIYLSATFLDNADKVHGLDAGADGYLTHPVEPPVLLAAVKALLRARRAERALVQSEAKFKAVFEQSLSGIALLSEDLIFLDANPAACALLGRACEAIVGRHLSAFSPSERTGEAEMTTSLAEHGTWRGYLPVLHADGRPVDLEWSVSILSVPGIRVAVLSDITERLKFEAERERVLLREQRARADAEQASQLKDRFLAVLSHELRTPLNAIVGWSHLLKRHAQTGDPDLKTGIEAIDRNARAQAQLIGDLLDVSAIVSGKLQLAPQWIDPAEVVRAALLAAQQTAAAKRVRITLEVADSPPALYWDQTRLQQVIWNLVDNAVKFSPQDATVAVRLGTDGGEVVLTVRDSGRGIDPEFLPYVFDRFRQEHSGSTRTFGGLGLGLSIVSQLVQAHGGRVTADSDGSGRGAVFIVRLPTSAVAGGAPPAGDVDLQPGARLRDTRVLVVEDDGDARAVLQRVLAAEGATVMAATTVDEAVAAIDGFAPAMLVSDIGMPERDGYDLIRHLRDGGWPVSRLPAIALSAFAGPSDRDRALAAGYQLHLAKPIDADQLVRGLVALLRR